MQKKITLVIIGLGSRGKNAYGAELLTLKDRAMVTAVAEPDEERLKIGGDEHNVPPEKRFHSAEELLAQPKLADAAIICVQDRQHVPVALAALRKGYDILLEKPVSPILSELQEIVRVAREEKRRVVVCHVLRYTDFFGLIKQTIDSGRLGKVINIQALENVRYWHQAHSFVRGNWRNAGLSSCMILQKCCHDMDILLWLTGKHCKYVSSFGSLSLFKEENAPKGSAMRCLDCNVADTCPYNAVRFYLDEFHRTGDDWPQNVVAFEPTEEKLLNALREGPYGRCVYHCDNDVVDHQVVNLELEDGSTCNFTMTAFTAHGGRTIRIGGTKGEILADMKANTIRVMRYGEEDEVIDVRKLADDFSGHAGGDAVMVHEFIDLVRGEIEMSPTLTAIDRSVESHLVALAAEESRLDHGRPIRIS